MGEVAEITPMPGTDAETVTAEAKRERARQAKAAFTGKVKYATVTTEELLEKGALLAAYARGTAVLMFVDILAGVHAPKDAKQAIEVARAALEISREEGLNTDVSNLSELDKEAAAATIKKSLRDFAAQIMDREGIALDNEGK